MSEPPSPEPPSADPLPPGPPAAEPIERTGPAIVGALMPALYVVATPIGNLEDIGRRAARVLRAVDGIAAEDTRTSRVLLQHLGSRARCVALHAHNEASAAAGLIARVQAGEAIALITDAGTPGISDPGARVVDAAHRAGVRVVPIPGASAVTTLLSAAGLPDGRFRFEGFLPPRPRQRRERLAALAESPLPLLLYEAPHRIAATAADLAALWPAERPVVIGRELTKQFEQIVRLPLGRLPAWLDEDPDHRRGEFALLVYGANAADRDAATGAAADGEAVAGGIAGRAPAGRAPATDEATGDQAAGSGAPAAVSALGLRALAVLTGPLPPRQAAKLAARISGDDADRLYREAVERRKGRTD